MDSVSLASIPEMMCALGYYPSQSAVTDMISSLAYMASMKKEPKPTSVGLEQLMFLYYNFSPVGGVCILHCSPDFLENELSLSAFLLHVRDCLNGCGANSVRVLCLLYAAMFLFHVIGANTGGSN